MDSVFLSLAEAADLLGYTRSYVYKLAERGQIPSLKPRGRLRFARKDLEDFLLRGRRAANYELTEDADRVLNALPRGRK